MYHHSVFQHIANYTRRSYRTLSPAYFAQKRFFFSKFDPYSNKLFYLNRSPLIPHTFSESVLSSAEMQ